MTGPASSLLRRWLAAAALVSASCAHAPAVRQDAAAAGVPGEAEQFVTGSHLPRRLDERGIPPTSSPARIYSRDDVIRTGHFSDLGRALRQLDPSL